MPTPSNKRSRVESDDGRSGQMVDDTADQKARKACINCRRQKSKCVIESNQTTCRRCRRSGLPCIFVPRANAASLPRPILTGNGGDDSFKRNVLRRLELLEDCLGISSSTELAGILEGTTAATAAVRATSVVDGHNVRPEDSEEEHSPEFTALGALWEAVAILAKSSPSSVPSSVWSKRTVKELWSSFHDRMPGLHFMPRRQVFSKPHPVLVASILYCSSSRGPPDVVAIATHYFTVLCNAIGQLCIPGSEIGKTPDDAEEWAFQTVLGIVLAGLLTEAHVHESGIWISVAYRLILQHCPAHVEESAREWRRLFSGVQIVDLEHASLHLSCPIIPIEAPLSGLRTSPRNQLYRLSRMMHTGLTHFTGRGLPTIWSCFSESLPSHAQQLAPGVGQAGNVNISSTSTFTTVDAAVIRDWARQLDEWLVEFSQHVEGSEEDRQLALRQYILHRLLVLSIYHPARGCDLWSRSITPSEQHELLLSARATLRLMHDDSIWSNWDIIMISWAALIVIQAIVGGAGEPDDLDNIRVHLDMLKRINEPKPSLRDKLIARLEESLVGVHTPVAAPVDVHRQPPPQQQQQQQQTMYHNSVPMLTSSLSPVDQSWQIFDQASLQQMIFPAWSVPAVPEQTEPT